MLDNFNRQVVHIEVDTSITSQRFIRIFEQLQETCGLPQVICSDNVPEFLGTDFVQWLYERGVTLQYIEHGKPTQNAYIERLTRSFREDVLDQYLFLRLHYVRESAYCWKVEYNQERPHESLGDLTPRE